MYQYFKEFRSATDDEAASCELVRLGEALHFSGEPMLSLTKLDTDDLDAQLSDVFTLDDAFLFGPQSILDLTTFKWHPLPRNHFHLLRLLVIQNFSVFMLLVSLQREISMLLMGVCGASTVKWINMNFKAVVIVGFNMQIPEKWQYQ
ncbi:hypothetical protein C5167_034641 [Papaver somniferum]|uniref:Uncharacterized protein n=1 Tax=Papaver somniferum TaxID=3469 RepID=A0A4Y7KF44_PAPSO|nr:hypothetical protein C5167_034641 [Papaver somniferum]